MLILLFATAYLYIYKYNKFFFTPIIYQYRKKFQPHVFHISVYQYHFNNNYSNISYFFSINTLMCCLQIYNCLFLSNTNVNTMKKRHLPFAKIWKSQLKITLLLVERQQRFLLGKINTSSVCLHVIIVSGFSDFTQSWCTFSAKPEESGVLTSPFIRYE